METVVDLICNGSVDFTPQVLVSLILFTLVLECIGSIAYSVLSMGGRCR